jgi:hypothetical protein
MVDVGWYRRCPQRLDAMQHVPAPTTALVPLRLETAMVTAG